MKISSALAQWEGSLKDGSGFMSLGSGAFRGAFSFASRFEEGNGTNPEELIGAAHAGCFSMALSAALGKQGYQPEVIETRAQVYLDKVEGKSRITRIHLTTDARVPGISEAQFQALAASTKEDCPVSAALKGVEITLEARLHARSS